MRFLLGLLLVALMAPVDGIAAEPVLIETRAVQLNPGQSEQVSVGALTYLGGIEIDSGDPRFGGYSGMVWLEQGRRLLAISDLGHWLALTLQHDTAGRLIGAANGELAPMLGTRPRPLMGKLNVDAEAMLQDRDGSLLVSFERRHRLLRYRNDGVPYDTLGEPVPAPPAIEELPENGGVEAVVLMPNGSLLLLSEEGRDAAGDLRAWIGRDSDWGELSYRARDAFQPTDAALLPNGDVLVLERRFRVIDGLAIRVQRVSGADIHPGARLQPRLLAELLPPLTYDNMEAMAVGRAADGGVLIYLLSDDNQNPLQRTLLMLFRLND